MMDFETFLIKVAAAALGTVVVLVFLLIVNRRLW